MGFSYLGDSYWLDITREERFFCAIAYNYISKEPVKAIQFINDKAKLGFGDKVINQEWEIGYEVALYRDLFHSLDKSLVAVAETEGEEGESKKYNLSKRTFDLCCFSEDAIIIIEAKAHGGFKTKQLESIKFDREYIPNLIGMNIKIKIVSLISSRYKPRNTTLACFDDKPLTWLDLEKEYNEPLFKKANEAFRQ